MIMKTTPPNTSWNAHIKEAEKLLIAGHSPDTDIIGLVKERKTEVKKNVPPEVWALLRAMHIGVGHQILEEQH